MEYGDTKKRRDSESAIAIVIVRYPILYRVKVGIYKEIRNSKKNVLDMPY